MFAVSLYILALAVAPVTDAVTSGSGVAAYQAFRQQHRASGTDSLSFEQRHALFQVEGQDEALEEIAEEGSDFGDEGDEDAVEETADEDDDSSEAPEHEDAEHEGRDEALEDDDEEEDELGDETEADAEEDADVEAEHDDQENEDEVELDGDSDMSPAMLQTHANSSGRVGAISLKLNNCGDSKTLGRMTAMKPRSVKQGVNTKLTLSGTVKRTVPGGTLDLTVKLTSFPYSTLGSLKKADICKDHTLDLYVGPIKGGTLTLKGMKCPIKKGKVESIAYLKLSRSNAAQVSIRAKHKSNKLLCTNIVSGR